MAQETLQVLIFLSDRAVFPGIKRDKRLIYTSDKKASHFAVHLIFKFEFLPRACTINLFTAVIVAKS